MVIYDQMEAVQYIPEHMDDDGELTPAAIAAYGNGQADVLIDDLPSAPDDLGLDFARIECKDQLGFVLGEWVYREAGNSATFDPPIYEAPIISHVTPADPEAEA